MKGHKMRLKLLIGWALIFAWQPGAVAAELVAPITSVVLYPGSATIFRSIRVAAGATQLVVPGLPVNFDTQTLRAEASGGIRIGQIVTQDASRTEALNPAVAALEASIQALQDQQAQLEVETKSGDIVKGYLERLGAATGDRAPPLDAKNLAAVIDTIGRSANATLAHSQKVAILQRELGKKIEAMQHDLARLVAGGKASRTVTINLVAERAGALQMSYQLNNAGWKPAYRAQLDSARSEVELERLATVSQKTGEDWTNVKLTLSTSQPRLSPNAVEPQPWLLTYHPPQPQSPAPPPPPSPAFAMRSPIVAAKVAVEERDPYIPPTFETQNTFATEFEVPARVTLPADGREVSLPLASQPLTVRQVVRVTPRIDRTAILTAEAERPAGVWRAGSVQLFRDGNYVGSSYWNPQAGERFTLFFGRDDLLRVSMDQVKQNSGTTGIFDRQNQRRMSDVVLLNNGHKTPVDVLVLESSPVSTSSEIKVQSTFEPKPTIETWERRQGVVGWVRTIAPNETFRIALDYDIQYAKEGSVSGLR